MNTINTLRKLIETGALGINSDTQVTLGFEYSDDVHHYTDDYQEDVFSNSDICSMVQEFLTTGVDEHMLDGKIASALSESEYVSREGYFIDEAGDEYDFTEACTSLGLEKEINDDWDEENAWEEVTSKMKFIPDDISEAIQYDYYEFGIDTSLTQYDHKRGLFTISMNLNTTAAALLETSYNFAGFKVTLDTDVASLTLK